MNRILEFLIKAKDLSSDVIRRVVSRIHEWRDASKKAASETAKASKQSADSMKAVNDAMKQTSVNWKAIAQQEEDEKRRKRDIIALEKELKQATLEAGKASGEAAEMAKQRAEMLQKGITQLKSQSTADFNAISLGMAAMNGNLAGVATGVINLANKFKILNVSMAACSVYGLAILAVVKIFTWWSDSIDEIEQKVRDFKMDAMKAQCEGIKNAWEAINDEIQESIRYMEESTRHINAVNDAKTTKAKAENDLKREAELAKTDDDDERARINRKWDERNAQLDVSNKDRAADRELYDAERILEQLRDERNRTHELRNLAHRNAKDADYDLKGYNAYRDKDNKDYQAAKERAKGYWDTYREVYKKEQDLNERVYKAQHKVDELKAADESRAKTDAVAAARRAREADEAERKVAEKKKAQQEALADELDEIWRDWYNADAEYQKNSNSEVAREKVKLLEDYYNALEKAETEKERAQIRADYARQARQLAFLKQLEDEQNAEYAAYAKQVEDYNNEIEKERAEREAEDKRKQAEEDKRVRKQILDDARQDLADSTDLQRQAQARATAAQRAVSQAWGWYRDRGSMERFRKEQDSDLEAQRQYAKDYYSLTHGRNAEKLNEALYLSRRGKTDELEEQMAKWRKGPMGLSVEDEATMRVAIARDEEQRANKELADINENTARAAEAVEAIAKAFENGGNE